MSAKTVFISYRRDSTGKAFARSLKQELTHHGYDAFFDVDSIDAGKWAEQIRKQVPERSHFLLLLTPGALDRCADPDDWVRREFDLAVQSKRNIVPVREESVDLTKLRETCPASMKGLFAYQIATVQSAGFERDVEILIERYIPPHKAPEENDEGAECVIHPTRLLRGADHLFGRESELAALDKVWNDPSKKVLTIVAFGGVGKTSVVIEWMARQAAKNWEGFERVFDWSFFSQGTREKGGASTDTFIAAALKFFGDGAMAESAASPWDKGARLAQVVAQRRSLFVLDGVEPLQHPPGPLAGEFKDPALATLLKSLAQRNSGLCIVTTRERVADLAPFRDTTSPEWQLQHLSTPAGVELLKTLGVCGTVVEFQQLVEDVKGHALTLNLFGRYLVKAHQGDIRKRDQVKFEKADAKTQGGYAFKTIGAYEKWLSEGGEDGVRSLAVLRLLGLFNRPADAGCLGALRREPTIASLTEPLIDLDDEDWNLAVSSLEECGLVSRTVGDKLESKDAKVDTALDAHPLIREFFAKQLREKDPQAWRAAHRRLYEHLCETTYDIDEPTLEDLQPLYQAVAHGCQAGLQQEACDKVYFARIARGNEAYAVWKLGAFGAELDAISCFFEQPWTRISPSLTEDDQAWLVSEASFRLRALGRMAEALEPVRAGLRMCIEKEKWDRAAATASNLSQLELMLGEVAVAVRDAEQSLAYADRGGIEFTRQSNRATLADSLHQAGRLDDARTRFLEAETMQADRQPKTPMLYSLSGFLYCDLLLAEPERVAWQRCLQLKPGRSELESAENSSRSVEKRAARTLDWWTSLFANASPLEIGLDNLSLSRVTLYLSILNSSATDSRSTIENLKAALDGLRDLGAQEFIVHGLLTRAWLQFLEGDAESGQVDLDEAWEIAERGPMRLHMADIHLYRARLFHAVKPYPWTSPQEDLAAARKLIEQCGYWRRKEELEDAEAAAKGW